MTGRTRVVAVAVGFVGGLASGLLGVGGGIVMVPGLVLALALGQRRAHGTSLAAIVPIGIVGAAVYGLDGGHIDLPIAAALAAGAVVGAPLGVRALAGIGEGALRWLFIIVALAAGVRLLLP
jgi:hypothetical protein